MVYRCKTKYRDKNNNIVGYTLISLDGKQENVKPRELKQAILNNSIQVTNLKLTSDGKLIDKDETEFIQDTKLSKQSRLQNILGSVYTPKNKTEAAENNYIMKKATSKRVGKAMTRALLIGMVCISLSGTLTGCGYSNTANASSGQVTEQSVQDTQDLQSVIDKLNSASKIKVDVKHFQLGNKAVISVDDEEIGVMQGKFVKLFDTIEFKTSDEQQIAVGDQGAHLMLDNWAVYDQDGNPTYQMQEQITIKFTKYIISNKNGNNVGYIKEDWSFENYSATVYDMNDNVIAEINQAPFRHDFTIEVKEDCEIDNVSLTTMSVNYMMSKLNAEKAEKAKKNNTKSSSNSRRSSKHR